MDTATSTTRAHDHAGSWNREFSGEVTETEPVMGDSMLITFTAPPALIPGVRAGQFVEILCRGETSWDPLLRRPYSVYDVDASGATITVLVRPYGRGSAWLCAQRPGTILSILGPLGNAFTVAEKSRNLLMVAGGVGAAPLLMLAKDATRRGLNVTYLLGGMTADALLDARFVPGEVEYVVATDDGSQGHHGFVTDVVPQYLQWADQVFACGPEAMFRSLRQVVLANRFGDHPRVQVSVERTMACGVGACLGCVVETKRGMKASCVDGPVFDMDGVIWS
ncbi:MAG: Dihydroorotate dehydrogenase (NAD(+)), electron transfer subunit [uncultured Thermomicrobiales bacterium]|uniref:Dihydroorotate dehydrogenase (NAD(+)), electron transfer subunit n=1 Tax=uncultured Thermomicrobiales bacterium TaxID=1645740 RepID=A0A6J4U8W1_9BACT|nr:MAG: Dihydroorotate dehydrogenase (NAD(+)), electron transfer subunit [uncultured Thermomicrobiales bacterium]